MAPKELLRRAVPGDRVGGRSKSISSSLPIQTCWPGDAGPLITWGLTVTRGPHKARQNLGIYRQQVIAPQQSDHALAGASRRRAGFSRSLPGQAGPAVPGRGGAGRRSGHHPRRGDAGAGHAVASTSSPDCCAARRPNSSSASAPICRCPRAPRSCWKACIHPVRHGARRPVRRSHRLLQRAGRVSGVHHRAHHHAPRSDLSQHLHRQAAGRAGDPRRGAERSVRAAAHQAVSGDRGFLSAAGGLFATASRW